MADGTVGGQAPTPDELHHRLQRAIFDPAPGGLGGVVGWAYGGFYRRAWR
jgi:hypothetical protein